MKFATARTSGPDGRLLVVSRDQRTAAPAAGIASSLREALEHWDAVRPALEALYDALNDDRATEAFPFDPLHADAPLPRAWQWLDASAFPAHGQLMQRAFDLPAIPTVPPLMYQGLSHCFLGPADDVPLPSEADGIDFEGEFGIVTGDVPMGCPADAALSHIRLLVQINDWSLRAIAPVEMKTGFGWIHAKPACSMAPIAVTPDEFGAAWRDGRLAATLRIERNGERFGDVPSGEMQFGFHELIAHAARTRALCAGTVIGSGTVSSRDYRVTGSCCIAERRAIEMIDAGAPATAFLGFGERVRMAARVEGQGEPFGVLDQRVVKSG